MDDRVETGWLFAFYGPLLTERQRKLLTLYCEEDFSLSEIAAREGISRQGVYDAVRRGARQLTKRDYADYDLLLCMDSFNVRNALRIVGSDPEGKIHKLLEYAGRADDVADPWYSDRFDIAYADILSGCQALLDAILHKDA